MVRQLLLFNDFSAAESRKRLTLKQRTRRLFFGDDIFISYSRSDSGRYAMALAAQMSKDGYLCFLDQLGTDPNRNLPSSLKEKLRLSTALVIVGTEGASLSRFVREEVRLFKDKKRPIHPINVGDALTQDDWPEIAGLTLIPESRKSIEQGQPSPETIQLLQNASRYRRRSQRLRLSLVAVIALIVLSVLSTLIWTSLTISEAQLEEELAIINAQIASEQANNAAQEQQRETSRAAVASVRTVVANNRAEEANVEALKRLKEAEAARVEAKQQTEIATRQRELAQRYDSTQKIRLTQSSFDQQNLEFAYSVLNQHAHAAAPTTAPHFRRADKALRADPADFGWGYLAGLYHNEIPNLDISHAMKVTSVALSPNGSYLATGSLDGKVKLRQLGAKDEQSLRGITGGVYSVQFSPDGTKLAYSGSGGEVVLCDMKTMREAIFKQRVDLVDGVALAFSPNSDLLVTAAVGDRIEVYDVHTKRELQPFTRSGMTAWAVAFSKNGELLASGDLYGLVHVWNVRTREEIWQQKQSTRGQAIQSISFSLDGNRLVSTDKDGDLKVWNASNGKQIEVPNDCSGVVATFSPVDQNTLAVGKGNGVIDVWDFRTPSMKRVWKGDASPVSAIAFSPTGGALAIGETNGNAKVLDLTPNHYLLTKPSPNSGSSQVAYSRDGRLFAASGPDVVRLWDAAGNELSPLRAEEEVNALAFSWDNKLLAAATDSGVIVWETNTFKMKTFPLNTKVHSVSFAKSGTTKIAVASDRGVGLLDISSKDYDPIRDYEPIRDVGRNSACYAVAFAPDGLSVAYSCDQFAVLLSLKSRAATNFSAGDLGGYIGDRRFSQLQFSPDGKILAGAGGVRIKLWDTGSKMELATFDGHAWPGPVSALAFSSNGTLLASAGQDRVIKVWDITTRQELLHLDGNETWVSSLAFSSDGRTLASGSMHYTVMLWPAKTDQPITTLKTVGR